MAYLQQILVTLLALAYGEILDASEYLGEVTLWIIQFVVLGLSAAAFIKITF